MCVIPGVKVSDGWVQCEGDFLLPTSATNHKVLIRVADSTEIDFIVDQASLLPVLPGSNWQEEADQRIEDLRMGTINIFLTVPSIYKRKKVKLSVTQVKHAFPFGSAIDANKLYRDDPGFHLYREYFYNMFNWAVLKNDVKWRFMETEEGNPKFDTPDKALDILEEKGIPVRGHCVSWGKEEKVPSWLKHRKEEDIKENVMRRIQYLTEHFKGRFAHWDVNNEDLHGRFYEEKTKNPQFYESMLNEMHKGDPDALLFTNDYQLAESSNFISAYRRQIMTFLEDGAPIHGVGIQAHYFDLPDVHLLKQHLDELAAIGLPLWITELHVDHTKPSKRATGYTDFLRMAFSHPAVGGIVFWDFWNNSMQYPMASLVDGTDFVDNAAGLAVRRLLHEEWKTEETFKPQSSAETLTFKAFYGTYELALSYKNEELWRETLEFTPESESKDLIVVVGSSLEIGNSIEGKRGIEEEVEDEEEMKRRALNDLKLEYEEKKRDAQKEERKRELTEGLMQVLLKMAEEKEENPVHN